MMMKKFSKQSLLYSLLLISSGANTAWARRQAPSGLDLASGATYTFDQFCQDFDRDYCDQDDDGDHEEYDRRKLIFEQNLQTIIQHNQLYLRQQSNYNEGGTSTVSHIGNNMAQRQALFEQKLMAKSSVKTSHVLGINEFADQLPEELPRGYDSMQSSRVRLSSSSSFTNLFEELNDSALTATSRRRRRLSKTEEEEKLNEQRLLDALGGSYVDVSDLPKAVDWRMKGVTTPVKNQGGCGSCWAFASTAVLESHIALNTNVLFELSEQELVSCAPNPQHCGGSGGCAGATAEIAMELVRAHGMVQEWEFGYQEYHGGNVTCSLDIKSSSALRGSLQDDDDDKKLFKGAVATIEDFAVLPYNNYTALMNVVAKLGPVAVSVACMPWHLYQSGVFYAPLVPGKATDLDHLVVVEGYGTDQETGEDYWLVRNSWGPLWGEGGYIRLKRVGDSECALDNSPENGVACTLDENGNPVKPEPQKICGNSGILADSVIPLGGHLL